METLLLSSGFEPLAKITWQKAITLIFTGKAETLEEHEDREIRSVSTKMKMPAVVRLLKFIRKQSKKIKFSRFNVAVRDNHTCQYCGDKLCFEEVTFDHVYPKSKGGDSDWTNIVVACKDCNTEKADRTPEQAGMKLLNQPHRPTWLPNNILFINKDKASKPWRKYLKD